MEIDITLGGISQYGSTLKRHGSLSCSIQTSLHIKTGCDRIGLTASSHAKLTRRFILNEDYFFITTIPFVLHPPENSDRTYHQLDY